MFPVFSLVFDEDIDEKTSIEYVQLFPYFVYLKFHHLMNLLYKATFVSKSVERNGNECENSSWLDVG